MDPEVLEEYKENFATIRQQARESGFGNSLMANENLALDFSSEEREREYEGRWNQGGFAFLVAYADLLTDLKANETAVEFFHGKIRETVKDPETAKLLSPTNHPLGTKRICVDTEYFETYNLDSVTLVDISEAPIDEITPTGLRTGGHDYAFDAIVFATGFDAMTGAILNVDFQGRAGQRLKDAWESGPRTYLGLCVAGFPNLFTITGPGSPSVLSNMIISIEQHVDWIADCMTHLRDTELTTIEATVDAQDAWVTHVNEAADATLYPQANSWYLGANVPGKPRVFMPYVGGVDIYAAKCDEVAANGYEGFTLGAADRAGAPA